MSKPDTWMPLYMGDYFADTMHLTTEEHGAYLLMLMTAWNRGGKLPNNDGQLALICRCDRKKWNSLKKVVLSFFEVAGDFIVQQRLLAEYDRAVKINEKQKANGSKGGRPKKRQTESGDDEIPIPESNPDETQNKPMGYFCDKPNHNPNETPSPSPSQLKPSDEESALGRSPPATSAGSVCSRLRRLGITGVNPSHPKLLALLQAGICENELTGIAEEPQAKGKGMAWLLATAEGRRRDAVIESLPGKRPPPNGQRMTRNGAAFASYTTIFPVATTNNEDENGRTIDATPRLG